MRAVGSVVVDAPAAAIVEFVLDPTGYPQADTKIRHIDILDRRDGVILQRVRGCMRWRVLGSSLRMEVRPHGAERIDIEALPGTISFPARLALAGFHGEFTFEPVEGGVLVTHVEEQRFRPNLAGRIAERLCAGWLQHHLAAEEMPALKRIVEARRAPTG